MLVADDLSHLVIFARQIDRGVNHSMKHIEDLIDKMKTDHGKQMVDDLLLEYWQGNRESFVWKLV